MCKLKPFILENGDIIQVSEYKIGRLQKYIKIFSELNGIDRVILFGSTLEERCREDSDMDFCLLYTGDRRMIYRGNLRKIWSLYPDSSYDDFLAFDKERFDRGEGLYTVMRDVKNRGVVVYDRQW